MMTIIAILMILGLCCLSTVHGHGLMIKPEGRAVQQNYKIESSAGWPTVPKGGANKPPCLELKATTPKETIPYGESEIEMQANDGANHVGPCKVFLVDPNNPKSTMKIGEMDDCMRSIFSGAGQKGQTIKAKMPINIDKSKKLPCDPSHCILRFDWTATHISVTNPELFDTCADVKIGDQGQTTTPSSTPSSGTTPTGATPTTSPPSTTAPTSSTTSPPSTTAPTSPSSTPAPPSSTTSPPSTTSEPTTPSTPSSGSNCKGTESRYDEWCGFNCPRKFCPESHCNCGQAQAKSKSYSACKGTSSQYDLWCQANCPMGNCPQNLCNC